MTQVEDDIAAARDRNDANGLREILSELPKQVQHAGDFVALGHAARTIHAHQLSLDAFTVAQQFGVAIAYFGAAQAATKLGKTDDALKGIEIYMQKAKHDAAFSRYAA